MLNDAFHDNDLEALIRFRTDGDEFNLRRLNSKTRTSKVLIRDLLFADDCALLAHTVDDIQAITNAFARSTRRFGLTISLKKTEVIYKPNPGYQTLKFYSAAHKLASNNTSSVRNFVGPDTLWGWPMAASPRACSTENWTPVIELEEDNESGIRTCLRQR